MPPVQRSRDGDMPFDGPEMENLIKCNQKLKELGIESTIRLPQIAVIGDQSAGKSSLIEALSMIKVPRAADCCTQCPLAINISAGDRPDSAWKCSIYIEERYKYEGSIANKKITKANPMGPWQATEMIAKLFTTTYNKDEVCTLIQAAQVAVLNPGTEVALFLPRNGDVVSRKQAVKFSPNVIRLDISEGNWPNLSFIDLPGVFMNTNHKQDSFLIELVDNLVKQYAIDKNIVNILTLPMTNDIANSKARRTIQELSAEERTLAVLTKPDLVEREDAKKQFMDKFLEKEPSPYVHSYYVVMMHPDTDMNQKDAREKEIDFFIQEPWCSMETKFQQRLGVDALRNKIRQVLFEKTGETLGPNLISIEHRLAIIEGELDQIPNPPQLYQIQSILLRLISVFKSSTEKLFLGNGNPKEYPFRPLWHNKVAKHFRTCVADGSPSIAIRTEAENKGLKLANQKIEKRLNSIASRKRTKVSPPIEIMSDDEEGMTPATRPTPKVKVEGRPGSRVSQRAEDNDNDITYCFTLEKIRELNKRYEKGGIPGHIHEEARSDMIRLSVSKWNVPLMRLIKSTNELIREHTDKLIEQVFGKYAGYELYPAVVQWVQEDLHAAMSKEWVRATGKCEMEMNCPYTLDECTSAAHAAECLQERRLQRAEARLKLFEAEAEADAQGGKYTKPTIANLPPDNFKIELEMFTGVEAYYEIACTRFTDSVCQNIVGGLFAHLSISLAESLDRRLSPENEEKKDQIQQLMAEHPDLERRRQDLEQERARLIEGKAYIENALGVVASDASNTEAETPAGESSVRATSMSISPIRTPTKRAGSATLPERPSTNKKLKSMTNLRLRDLD